MELALTGEPIDAAGGSVSWVWTLHPVAVGASALPETGSGLQATSPPLSTGTPRGQTPAMTVDRAPVADDGSENANRRPERHETS